MNACDIRHLEKVIGRYMDFSWSVLTQHTILYVGNSICIMQWSGLVLMGSMLLWALSSSMHGVRINRHLIGAECGHVKGH